MAAAPEQETKALRARTVIFLFTFLSAFPTRHSALEKTKAFDRTV